MTASGMVQQSVSHQYPARYPEACDPKVIAGQESMFCNGVGAPVLEPCALRLHDSVCHHLRALRFLSTILFVDCTINKELCVAVSHSDAHELYI